MTSAVHSAPVAQLDRASDFESEGRGFESLQARHNIEGLGCMSRPLFCSPRHGLPHCFFSNVPRFSFPGRPPLPSGRGGPSPVAPGPDRFARTEAKPVPCGRLGRFLRFAEVFQSVALKEPNRNLHPLVPFEPGGRCSLPFFYTGGSAGSPGRKNRTAARRAGGTGKGRGPGGATRRPVWLWSARLSVRAQCPGFR